MLSLEKAKQLFLNDIDEKRISHAYMISSSAIPFSSIAVMEPAL